MNIRIYLFILLSLGDGFSLLAQDRVNTTGIAYVLFDQAPFAGRLQSLPELYYTRINKGLLSIKIKLGYGQFSQTGYLEGDYILYAVRMAQAASYNYHMSGYYAKIGLPFGKTYNKHFETYWCLYNVSSYAEKSFTLTGVDRVFGNRILYQGRTSDMNYFSAIELEKSLVFYPFANKHIGILMSMYNGLQWKQTHEFSDIMSGIDHMSNFRPGLACYAFPAPIKGLPYIYLNMTFGITYHFGKAKSAWKEMDLPTEFRP